MKYERLMQGDISNALLDRIEAEGPAKATAERKGQPRSRRGNAPKFNKAKARARVKAARKARRAGR